MDFYPTETKSNNYFDLIGLPLNGSIQADHLIPYAIITLNFVLFKLLRSFVNKIVDYYQIEQQQQHSHSHSNNNGESKSNSNSRNKNKSPTTTTGNERGRSIKLLKLFIDELISTCELCTDCAELNVVYEKHGSLAYGLSLFILTYLWMDAFGEAHTTPGYLIEDYFLINGSQTLKTGSTYARFIGQSLAMPLAWRFASFYWGYKLLGEHKEMLIVDNCKSALSTSTLNGFIIEFICCMLCRLIELYGHRMLENRLLSQRVVSLLTSFICTSLVVMALETSGGYFNPILASGLEFGCKGINLYQHALVFWLGPLTGHVMARALYKRLAIGGAEHKRVESPQLRVSSAHNSTSAGNQPSSQQQQSTKKSHDAKRLTRSSSQKKKQKQV